MLGAIPPVGVLRQGFPLDISILLDFDEFELKLLL
jgi:hypothetical protein